MKTFIKMSNSTSLKSASIAAHFNDSTEDSERIYGDGTNSSIGPQLNQYYYDKKAIIDIKKDQYFGQLADVTVMP